jgi:hypothetical protein
MNGELVTPAWHSGRLGPWGKFDPGNLSLSEGIVAFASDAHGLLFQAPLEEVRARFPKLYFGIGMKLAVGGKTHRLWFVPMQSMRGETTSEGKTVVVGKKFSLSAIGPARAAVRRWRVVLSQPTHDV